MTFRPSQRSDGVRLQGNRKVATDRCVMSAPDSRGWGPERRDTPAKHTSPRKIYSMKTRTSATNRDAGSKKKPAPGARRQRPAPARPEQGPKPPLAVAGRAGKGGAAPGPRVAREAASSEAPAPSPKVQTVVVAEDRDGQ